MRLRYSRLNRVWVKHTDSPNRHCVSATLFKSLQCVSSGALKGCHVDNSLLAVGRAKAKATSMAESKWNSLGRVRSRRLNESASSLSVMLASSCCSRKDSISKTNSLQPFTSDSPRQARVHTKHVNCQNLCSRKGRFCTLAEGSSYMF